MDTSIAQLSGAALALVPVVMAITQGIKVYLVDSKWAFISSLVVGVALSFLVPAPSVTATILQGVLMGLSASAVFTGVRATVQ